MITIVLFFSFNGGLLAALPLKDDTAKYSNYALVANIYGRTRHWDAGIEDIRKISPKLSVARQITFYAGLYRSWHEPEGYFNPRYVTICFQPVHLLLGGPLRFETGFSANLQLYSYLGKKYPAVQSFSSAQDVLILIYSVGLRYSVQAWQVSFKFLVGPAYGINLQSGYTQLLQSGAGEIGASWRFRKKLRN